MRTMHLWAGAIALAAVIPTPALAQRVRADVVIADGPVRGRVVIGSAPVVRERVIVYSPRRLKVDRYHADHRYGSRVIREVVYYDPYRDRFFDGYQDGLYRVEVYLIGGRYYRHWDRREWARYERHDRYNHRDSWYDRRDDRYDRRDDRYDRRDSRYDRRGDRYDRRDDRYRQDDRYDRRDDRYDRRDDRDDHRNDRARGRARGRN